jgi:DDE superfamily endonuclease
VIKFSVRRFGVADRPMGNPRPGLSVVTHNNTGAEGSLIVYQSAVQVREAAYLLILQALRSHRDKVGSRWRKLPDETVAGIVLAVLRHGQRPADLAAAHGLAHTTVRRWLMQVITGLAAQLPRLDRVLDRAERDGLHVLLLDGSFIPTDRPGDPRAEHAHYSGKHHAPGLLVLGLSDQAGNLLWVSAAVAARTAEITLARRYRIPARLRQHEHLGLICDLGFTKLDDQPDNPTVITGRRASRHHPLTPAEQATNRLISRERLANEHAFNHLKRWRILDRLHGSFRRHATTLIRALMILTNAHVTR